MNARKVWRQQPAGTLTSSWQNLSHTNSYTRAHTNTPRLSVIGINTGRCTATLWPCLGHYGCMAVAQQWGKLCYSYDSDERRCVGKVKHNVMWNPSQYKVDFGVFFCPTSFQVRLKNKTGDYKHCQDDVWEICQGQRRATYLSYIYNKTFPLNKFCPKVETPPHPPFLTCLTCLLPILACGPDNTAWKSSDWFGNRITHSIAISQH